MKRLGLGCGSAIEHARGPGLVPSTNEQRSFLAGTLGVTHQTGAPSLGVGFLTEYLVS